MKFKLCSLLLALMTALLLAPDSWASATVPPAVPAASSTNSPATVNQLMIDILTGVKTAGSEVYDVSKATLRQAYGFVEREAPEVLKEFMRWRLFHALLWCLFWIVVAFIGVYWSRRFKKLADSCPAPEPHRWGYGMDDHGKSGYVTCRYIALVLSTVVLLGCLTTQVFDVVKIVVAPRVYIIEYVTDVMTSANQSRHSR